MSVFCEGELEFTFGGAWQAEKFDQPGASWPKGISPVDFIAEGQAELVLMEVKDPSASAIPAKNRQDFIAKMQTKELIYEELVPKARSSYGFLHTPRDIPVFVDAAFRVYPLDGLTQYIAAFRDAPKFTW